MKRSVLFTLLVTLVNVGAASAANVDITGGQTSVFLDSQVLGPLGLSISRVSDDVINPGSLPDSVAFNINPRDAVSPALPTTFSYDSDDFVNTFSGTLEHTGSLFILDADMDETEVGNFTIGFDASRITADASGFYVESTVGLMGILFDIGNATVLDPRPDGLTTQSPLLVSPELDTVLEGGGALAGATIGEAKIEAVPEPTSIALMLVGLIALLITRRK